MKLQHWSPTLPSLLYPATNEELLDITERTPPLLFSVAILPQDRWSASPPSPPWFLGGRSGHSSIAKQPDLRGRHSQVDRHGLLTSSASPQNFLSDGKLAAGPRFHCQPPAAALLWTSSAMLACTAPLDVSMRVGTRPGPPFLGWPSI